MKLEVGMYVRTKKGIAKLIEQINDVENYWFGFWITDRFLMINDDTEYIHEVDIIGEPSFDIIDLIEVGDILHDKNDNEYWTVQRIEKDESGNPSIQIEWEGFENEEEFLNAIDEIITKEQAKNISYKIGD